MGIDATERRVDGRVESVTGVNFVPAALTDSGCEREFNEDRYAVIEGPSGLGWLVCDGMGGVMGGELAAQLAIDTIRRDLEGSHVRRPDEALRSAIMEANRVIILRRQNEMFANMGTTIVGALFQGPEMVVAHVGDSRAYLVRFGEIRSLTVDHTYVQSLVEKGEISAEEALRHPQAHILSRCIGAEPGLEVPVSRHWIWDSNDQNDLLVLVTDGLYSLVNEDEIAAIVSASAPPTACVRLVELAKTRGGYDNITVAVIPLGGELRNEPPPEHAPWAGDRVIEKKKKTTSRKKPKGSGKAKESRSSSFLRRLMVVLFTLVCVGSLVSIVFL